MTMTMTGPIVWNGGDGAMAAVRTIFPGSPGRRPRHHPPTANHRPETGSTASDAHT